ncbi:MAG: septal ring lytic transglycosylase RlpA family protein [Candidatus Acidiferrales bacterium]|jgi:rare lipoprotein A
MRSNILVGLQSVLLGLGLLVLTPSVNPMTYGNASNPAQIETSLQGNTSFGSLSSQSKVKPLAVWQCVTGWYGEDFDGQPTANGETYDMYATTAAHPTLPLGSIIRVVNTHNHRSQVVRINDRGPYVEGRELDVSYEVARRLGFDERGLAKVRIELLEVPSRPTSDRRN